MKTLTGYFTFSVPKTHADSTKVSQNHKGEDLDPGVVEKSFSVSIPENETEADVLILEKKDEKERKSWGYLELFIAKMTANARSNAYQTAMAKYKPDTKSKEDAIEAMVRDYVRRGINEDVARTHVKNLLDTVEPDA